MEIWKDVIGYEGMYQVSNCGRIKSLKRKFVLKDVILKNGINQNGYPVINLCDNGEQKLKTIHRIVLEAFTEPESHKNCINHIDGNKINNNINNLEWCTQKENVRHAFRIGLSKRKKGEESRLSRLTNTDVHQIRCMYKFKSELSKECGYLVTNKMIGECFDMSLGGVYSIISRKSWGHI